MYSGTDLLLNVAQAFNSTLVVNGEVSLLLSRYVPGI